MAMGQSESQAVESIRKMQAEMKRNPDMFLQPTMVKNGHVVENPAFKKRYGDANELYKKTMSKSGGEDYKQKLAMDKELEDMRDFRLGKKRMVGNGLRGY